MHGFDTSIPQFVTQIWGTHIVVTPNIIFEILHVPWVSHPNYPACPHLRTVPKDELFSHFWETPSLWGEHLNTSYSSFAKGSRFLIMVMTFVLHLLSHYNFITEPCACFLLSLLENLSIDFPSHFILSLIVSMEIRQPVISLFSLQLSCRSFVIFLSLFLSLILLSLL